MSENIKVPKLRFPQYTDAWEQRKFGDVGSVSMCKRVFKEETSSEGEIPFFKIGTFGGTPDAFISREMFEEYKAKFPYPEAGAILLSASGTIGRIVEYTGESAYFQDSNIVWLSHDSSVTNKFLKVLYPTVKWDGIEGSTIQRLYNDNFLKTSFMLPSIPEQEKIGTFFEQVEDLITLHQRKLEKAKSFKSGMLQKMFPRDGELVPEIRFPGFTDAWEQRKISEVAEVVGGGTPSTSNPEYWDGDINWYAPAEIGEQIYVDSSKRKITKLGLEKSSARMLPAHKTVLFTSRAGIGNTAILRTPAATNQGFQSMVLHDDINPYFVYSMTGIIKAQAEKIASGSTFAEISGKMLGNLELKIPSKPEQDRIAGYFESLDNLITLHQRKLEQMKEYKAGLLQQMFI